MKGVKSKLFGCYWESMFLSALCYPDRIDPNNKSHLQKRRHMRTYIHSMKYVLSCRYCRCFVKNKLIKEFPLDMSGKIQLMKSIYIWRDQVNKKLIKQELSIGKQITKDSPPFEEIMKKYSKYYAKCDQKIGKCI